MERKLKESLADIKKSKDDNTVKYTVSESKKKFGDISNKIEVRIPELQMSFYVDKGTSVSQIEEKRWAYLNRSGAFLAFKAPDE
jgi:hypothetical protein